MAPLLLVYVEWRYSRKKVQSLGANVYLCCMNLEMHMQRNFFKCKMKCLQENGFVFKSTAKTVATLK